MAPAPDVPRSLQLAAAVAGLQGLVMLVLAVVELASLAADRLGVALSVSAFFAVVGVGLLLAARSLWRAESWARGPALLAQLILLGTAWQARVDAPLLLILGLVAVALLGLGALVHPATTARLAQD